MKKLFLLAAAAVIGGYGMDAATRYVVFSGDELTADEVQMPTEYNGWWNMKHETVADPDAAEQNVWRFASENGSEAASCGYWVNYGNAPASFDLSNLTGCDLVFNAKIVGNGSWLIRVTSPDSDARIEIPADGEYHEVRINVARDFAAVLDYWNAGAQQAFIFSPVGSGLDAQSALCVYDVRYEQAVPMPSISASVSDVTSVSANLTYNVEFPEGYANTSVTLNGEDAAASATLNLADLSPKTEYIYIVKAEGEFNGKTFSAEKNVTFTTAREAGDLPVWYGLTEKDGFTAAYSITYNADKTLTVEAEIETEKETPEGDRNFHIYIGGNEWLKLHADAALPEVLTGTTESTFEEGAEITWEWYLPYAGGVYQESNLYIVGSENEKPAVAPRLSVNVADVTFNSASIAYEVTNASDFTNLVVKMNEQVVTESPVVVTDLDENTEYTYTFSVTGDRNGETFTGKDVKISFKTLRENAVDLVYADYIKAELKNAYLAGEDAGLARTFYVSLPFQVTYKADGTAKYEIDLAQVESIVGLVPQIYWNGFKTLSKNAETGLYEYDFGVQESGADVSISHYLAYAGGVLDQNFHNVYGTWGVEQSRPQIGAPASLSLNVSKPDVRVGVPFPIDVRLADANGYFMPASDVEFEAEGAAVSNGLCTVADKGVYTLKGLVGSLEAETSFACFINASSENLVKGKAPYAYDPFTAEGAENNITDDSEQSEAIWSCADSDEHYAYFDLGAEYAVEGITMVWEGAYATAYDIVLSLNKLGESAPVVLANGITSDHTIEVTGNNSTRVSHAVMGEDGSYDFVKARYVGLKTKTALNSDWGIKPRDLKVYGGSWDVVSALDMLDIDNSDAPVEYYNLQGVRVLNPENGLFIRRQGNKSEKVLVK